MTSALRAVPGLGVRGLCASAVWMGTESQHVGLWTTIDRFCTRGVGVAGPITVAKILALRYLRAGAQKVRVIHTILRSRALKARDVVQ